MSEGRAAKTDVCECTPLRHVVVQCCTGVVLVLYVDSITTLEYQEIGVR